MKYLGSKASIAGQILPLILKNRKPGQTFVEPFAGGCNTLSEVENPRIAGDTNQYLIAMFKAIQDGWNPPKEFTEEQYDRVHAFYSPMWAKKSWVVDDERKPWRKKPYKKHDDDYPDSLIGYVGFVLSYSAKWWGGYRRDSIGKRNYARESYNELMKQAPKLKGIKFYCASYKDIPIPPNSIIYCDPPYDSTTSYSETSSDRFDSKAFWEWCREMIKAGHQVFVSEYTAPDDFKEIWKKDMIVRVSNSNKKQTTRTEKLFALEHIKESKYIKTFDSFI